jgi:hypothetical protein
MELKDYELSEIFKAELTDKQWLIVANMVNSHSRENRYVLSDEDYQAALNFISAVKSYCFDED